MHCTGVGCIRTSNGGNRRGWNPVMPHPLVLAGNKGVPFVNVRWCALGAECTHPGPLLQLRLRTSGGVEHLVSLQWELHQRQPAENSSLRLCLYCHRVPGLRPAPLSW